MMQTLEATKYREAAESGDQSGVQSAPIPYRFAPVSQHGSLPSALGQARTQPIPVTSYQDGHQYGIWNHGLSEAEVMSRLSGQHYQTIQGPGSQSQNPFVNAVQAPGFNFNDPVPSPSESVQAAVPAASVDWQIFPTQFIPPTAQATFEEPMFNSVPLASTSATSRRRNRKSRVARNSAPAPRPSAPVPGPSRGNCCGKKPAESSSEDSDSTVQEVPILSSPENTVLSMSPDQVQTPKSEVYPNEGNKPEASQTSYAPFANTIPHTSVYSVPANYATAENPMTLDRQAHIQQYDLYHRQEVPHYAPAGIAGMAAPPAEPYDMAGMLPPSDVQQDPSTFSHECSCGDGCECLACPVHPYNNRTTNHVRGLYRWWEAPENRHDESRPQSSYGEPSHTDTSVGPLSSQIRDMSLSSPIGPSGRAAPENATRFIDPTLLGTGMNGSVTAASNGYQSAGYPDPTAPGLYYAPSSDYLTMQYTLSDFEPNICSNPNGACRCSQGCSCVGCSLHTGHEE
ncbi:MAG: hypothetical protein Q9218_003051 [Villophora microphyllina]